MRKENYVETLKQCKDISQDACVQIGLPNGQWYTSNVVKKQFFMNVAKVYVNISTVLH